MRRDWEPEDPGPADLRAGHRPLSSVIASAYFTLRLVTRTRALGRYRDLGAPLPERVSRKVNRSDSCPCPEIPLLGHDLQWPPCPPQESRWCRVTRREVLSEVTRELVSNHNCMSRLTVLSARARFASVPRSG